MIGFCVLKRRDQVWNAWMFCASMLGVHGQVKNQCNHIFSQFWCICNVLLRNIVYSCALDAGSGWVGGYGIISGSLFYLALFLHLFCTFFTLWDFGRLDVQSIWRNCIIRRRIETQHLHNFLSSHQIWNFLLRNTLDFCVLVIWGSWGLWQHQRTERK